MFEKIIYGCVFCIGLFLMVPKIKELVRRIIDREKARKQE